jgi:hypothetical protein
MKRLILVAVLLLPLLGSTQNKILDREFFEFSNRGLAPSEITVYKDSLSKEELYTKALAWIDVANESIKDCTIKLVSSKPNDFITIRGELPFYLCEVKKDLKFRCFNTRFTVDLIFFDGSYIVRPKTLKFEANNNTLWLKIKLDKKSKTIYKSDGSIRPTFITFPSSIKMIFNIIDISLFSYLINDEPLRIEMY